MQELEIRLMQRPDRTRFLQVRLRSSLKKGLVVTTDVPDTGSQFRTEQAVFAAGGALAEHLGFKHGENVDCEEVARQAREAFREVMLEARLN